MELYDAHSFSQAYIYSVKTRQKDLTGTWVCHALQGKCASPPKTTEQSEISFPTKWYPCLLRHLLETERYNFWAKKIQKERFYLDRVGFKTESRWGQDVVMQSVRRLVHNSQGKPFKTRPKTRILLRKPGKMTREHLRTGMADWLTRRTMQFFCCKFDVQISTQNILRCGTEIFPMV